MFNPGIYANSPADGFGVLQVTDARVAPEEAQRFVPLQRTTLTGTVAGPLAALTLTQVFAFGRADFDGVVEAAYRFPLPGDAAVRAVRVHFGEVEIQAALQPRAEAEAAYVAAKEAGHQAALLTREAPDVFTLHVTGIKPDEPVEVTTDFVQLARAEGLDWLLRIPLTTAPRYVRADDLATAHAQGQPFALLHDPGHRFELDVVFHGAGAVTSPTHELARAGDDEARRVQLAAGAVVPDRDCVLVWRPVQATTRPTLSVFTTHDEAHTYFLALVAPPAATTTTLAREVIVLLDHSGSMTGPKWQAADWAVERLLLDLTADDVFDLCLFHTSTTWFAPAPQPAEDGARVDEAVAWLKSRRDSGGTNLGVALEEALRLPRIEAATPARNVLIVTDAAVTDGGRILRLADQEADREDRRRISVLCIDAAPNAFLANELAARGGGQAVFLTSRPDAEDITTALEAVLTTWAAPVRTDLRLVVPGGEIEGADGGRRGDDAAALDVGDLPARQVRWVVGRVPRGEETLHMQLHDGTGVVAEAGADALTEAMAAIKPLFGVRRVNALEFLSSARYEDAALREQLQRLGYDPATVLPTGREQSVYAETAAKETAAALHDLLRDEALRYGLLTSATAFVAVRTEAGHAVEREVVVANALPEGWSSQFVGAFGTPGVRSMRHNAAPMAMPPRPEGPEMFAAGLPPGAQMPAAAHAMAPGPAGGGAMPTWRTVFQGTLPAGPEEVLYDSPGDEASGELLSALRVTFDGGSDAAAWDAAALQGVTLLLYVGDTTLPRARVRLADLVRTPERPLNVARRPGDLLRLVLVDPEGRLAEKKPAVQIELQARKT